LEKEQDEEEEEEEGFTVLGLINAMFTCGSESSSSVFPVSVLV
jgi:hypothetical protein